MTSTTRGEAGSVRVPKDRSEAELRVVRGKCGSRSSRAAPGSGWSKVLSRPHMASPVQAGPDSAVIGITTHCRAWG